MSKMNITLLEALTTLSEQINAIAYSLPNLKSHHRDVFFGELIEKTDLLADKLKSVTLTRQNNQDDHLQSKGSHISVRLTENNNHHTSFATKPPHNGFPQRLKHAMKAAGLTQKELAERAGVSQGFVSKLATGKTTDSRNIYIKLIADALGVSFGWLHYGTGEMYPANFSADNREV